MTKLLSIHFWIIKFLLPLIQCRVLTCLPYMFLVSFCIHPLLSCLVPKTETPRSLDPIITKKKFKMLSIPTTCLFLLVFIIYSMIIVVISMSFLPYLFGFSTLTDRSTLCQKPVAAQYTSRNFYPFFTGSLFTQNVFNLFLNFFIMSSIDNSNPFHMRRLCDTLLEFSIRSTVF